MDGLSGAGLFRRLTYPGAPRYAVDPRPIEEILASGELGKNLTRLLREQSGTMRARDGKQTGQA
jgi:hypothetical protein